MYRRMLPLMLISAMWTVYAGHEEMSSFEQLTSKLSSNRGNVIFVDDEGTLLHPVNTEKREDQYGTAQWGAREIDNVSEDYKKQKIQEITNLYDDFVKHGDRKEEQQYQHPYIYTTSHVSPGKRGQHFKPVEEGALQMLRSLHMLPDGLNCDMYVVTDRSYDRLGNATIAHLDGHSVPRTNVEDDIPYIYDSKQQEDNKNLKIASGVVFTRGCHKGHALLRFLEKKYGSDYTNKNVIFVDDKLKRNGQNPVDQFSEQCNKENMASYAALRYTGSDQYVKKLLPDGRLP